MVSKITAAGLLLLLSPLLAQQPEYFENSRINFVYEKTARGQSGMVTFNTRWDLKDAKKFYMLPFSLYSSLENIDLKRDIKLKYYGYRISPFKIINISSSKKNLDISGEKEAANGDSYPPSSAASSRPERKKKKFIVLSALYDDLQENMDSFILENSLKPISSQWSSVSKEGKKEFMKDLSSLGIFNDTILSPIGKKADELSR
ncbi:MAG: hypothetical protein Fur0012_11170 [Elusimicrobiota bacterium]